MDPSPLSVADAAPPARAGARQWAGLALLVLPAAVLSLDMTMLHLAVPRISADLHPSSTQLLWMIDIYSFLMAGLLIAMGTLGDRIGRRRLLLTGAVAFAVVSALAAFAAGATMLIVARAALGVAGATLMPSTLSLLRRMFPDGRQRAVAISIWSAGFSTGAALGPVVGGLLLEHWWWGSLFLVAVPVMGLLAALGPVLLPESRAAAPGRLDAVSVALSLGAVLGAVYGLKKLTAEGVTPLPALVLVAGLALGACFVLRQRRLPVPLLDLRLFSDRAFSTSVGTVTACVLTYAGMQFFIAQYLQSVAGLGPFEAGLWLLPGAVVGALASLLGPLLARRFPRARVIAAGLVMMAAGFATLSRLTPGADPLLVAVAFTLMAIGYGPVFALGTDTATAAAPPDRTGNAASVVSVTGDLGISLGIAVLGSIGTAVYRANLPAPTGTLPAEALHTAREGIAAATSAAPGLPPATATHLLDTTSRAFLTALETVSLTSTALAVVCGALVLAAFRRRGGAGTGVG